jgi:nucleoside-diphosphate-sugar epimerase
MALRPDSNIFLAGHRGMVGSAILCALQSAGFDRVITAGRDQLDLTEQAAVRDFFQRQKIDYVIVAAARVGGIHANYAQPADFIYDNLMIECNLIHQAFKAGVRDLLFLGSSCIYPKFAEQPIREEALLSGPLEPTNDAYAIAKIAGIKLCHAYNRQHGTHYRALMPTNLYGPRDNFHLENSHVIPALLRKFHDAKLASSDFVPIWGSGTPRREFLHVDDLAAACLHIMQLPQAQIDAVLGPDILHINAGTGEDLTILELAGLIADVVGYRGQLRFDPDKPDGTPRKLLDVTRLRALGWQARISLWQGLGDTYRWYTDNIATLRR